MKFPITFNWYSSILVVIGLVAMYIGDAGKALVWTTVSGTCFHLASLIGRRHHDINTHTDQRMIELYDFLDVSGAHLQGVLTRTVSQKILDFHSSVDEKIYGMKERMIAGLESVSDVTGSVVHATENVANLVETGSKGIENVIISVKKIESVTDELKQHSGVLRKLPRALSFLIKIERGTRKRTSRAFRRLSGNRVHMGCVGPSHLEVEDLIA